MAKVTGEFIGKGILFCFQKGRPAVASDVHTHNVTQYAFPFAAFKAAFKGNHGHQKRNYRGFPSWRPLLFRNHDK